MHFVLDPLANSQGCYLKAEIPSSQQGSLQSTRIIIPPLDASAVALSSGQFGRTHPAARKRAGTIE